MTSVTDKSSKRVCPLPYPDKFYAAINFVEEILPGKKPFTQETLLVLYGLQQQAMQGVCKDPKPQGWDTLEAAKWKSWHVLGSMSQVEAMRLFVRTVEEEQNDWWEVMQIHQAKLGQEQQYANNQSKSAASKQQQQQQQDQQQQYQQQIQQQRLTQQNQNIQPMQSKQQVYGQSQEQSLLGYQIEGGAQYGDQSNLKQSQPKDTDRNGQQLYTKVEDQALQVAKQQLQEVNVQKNSQQKTKRQPQQQQSVLDICLREMQSQNHFFALTNPGGAKKPQARYEHAVAINHRKLYVVGGIFSGRLLSDVWILNLDSMQWMQTQYQSKSNQSISATPTASQSQINQSDPNQSLALTHKSSSTCLPIAGHQMVALGDKILIVGGLSKNKNPKVDIEIWALEVESLSFNKLQIKGQVPSTRGGHTATLVQNKIYIFGGEDPQRENKSELLVFDIQNQTFEIPTTKGLTPKPRAQHVATAYRDKFLIIFGGGTVAQCYNDLNILDTETLEWILIPVQGQAPSPRAGHAATLSGDVWYIIGGGDNLSGCHDIHALELRLDGPLTWHYISDVAQIESLASEGLSLTKVADRGCLVSFGGYNGSYNNQVVILRTPFIGQDDEAGNFTEGLGQVSSSNSNLMVKEQDGNIALKNLGQSQPTGAYRGEPDLITGSPGGQDNQNMSKAGSSIQDDKLQQVKQAIEPITQEPLNKQQDNIQKQGKVTSGDINGGEDKNVYRTKEASNEERHQQQNFLGGLNGFAKAALNSQDPQQLQEILKQSQEQLAAVTKDAQNSQEAAQKELALMRKQLASSQSSHQNFDKELQRARKQLQEEQESKMQIMVEVADLKKKLDIMEELKKEVDRYKQQVQSQQKDLKGSQRSSGSGVWGYIIGQ